MFGVPYLWPVLPSHAHAGSCLPRPHTVQSALKGEPIQGEGSGITALSCCPALKLKCITWNTLSRSCCCLMFYGIVCRRVFLVCSLSSHPLWPGLPSSSFIPVMFHSRQCSILTCMKFKYCNLEDGCAKRVSLFHPEMVSLSCMFLFMSHLPSALLDCDDYSTQLVYRIPFTLLLNCVILYFAILASHTTISYLFLGSLPCPSKLTCSAENAVYPVVSRFVVHKPTFNMREVPLLSTMLYSSSSEVGTDAR